MNELENKDTSEIEPASNRCYWCHAIEEEDITLHLTDYLDAEEEVQHFYTCSVDHEHKVLRHFHFITQWRILYYILIYLIPVILVILFVIFNFNFIFVFPVFISFGLGLIAFPNLSQKTIDGLGLKRSIILGRVLGIILVCIGLTLFIINGVKIFVS